MPADAVPDFSGWEAYCEECKVFHEARRMQARGVSDGTEYFELVCNTCHTILLTFQRFGTQKKSDKQAVPASICSETCPVCGELNTFPGFTSMDAYVCRHCGEGVHVQRQVQ